MIANLFSYVSECIYGCQRMWTTVGAQNEDAMFKTMHSIPQPLDIQSNFLLHMVFASLFSILVCHQDIAFKICFIFRNQTLERWKTINGWERNEMRQKHLISLEYSWLMHSYYSHNIWFYHMFIHILNFCHFLTFDCRC